MRVLYHRGYKSKRDMCHRAEGCVRTCVSYINKDNIWGHDLSKR